MFNAPFVPDLSRRIVGPLAVQYAFEASPKWHAQNPGSMDAIGNLLLQLYTVEIHNWLQGARHNARMSNLPVWRSRYMLPGMSAEYTRSSRSESLRLVAQPESAGDRIPTKITVSPGEVVDVRASFNGWPIPGYPVDNTNIATTSMYWWDFASTPGWWDSDAPLIQASETPWPTIDWQAIKAGSRVVPTVLQGKQYWEVEIVDLPTGVPGSVSLPQSGTDNGSFVSSSISFANNAVITRLFPQELNTWLSPAIGVMPVPALKPKGKGFETTTHAIMGLEKDMSGATGRSVYVTRASFARYVTASHAYNTGGVLIHDVAAAHDVVGNRYYYHSAGSSVGGPLYDPKDPAFNTHTFWNAVTIPGGGLIAAGNNVYQMTSPATGSGGNSGGPPTHIYDPVDNVTWNVTDVGSNGGAMSCWSDVTQTTLGTFGTIVITQPSYTDSTDAPGAIYGDTLLGFPSTLGEYGQILTGRADVNGGPVGMDLGPLRVGDVVMIAVDATPVKLFDAGTGGDPFPISGLIYFGKNGEWYTFDATRAPWFSKHDKAFDAKNGWAMTLDVGLLDDNKPIKFYPAVSWRVGPVHVRIRLGTSQKYKPPKGFKALTQGPSDFTIPGPSKIA